MANRRPFAVAVTNLCRATSAMDTWNREDLYAEVWERPMVKVAAKYGISSVMLGKVCRKLKIPVPGRGYWAKKEFGKPVERIPLPEAKDLPVVQRLKERSTEGPQENSTPAPEPTDPEYKRIVEIEHRTFVVNPGHSSASRLARLERRCQRSQRRVCGQFSTCLPSCHG
jgi:hypothetical protein